MAPFQGNGRLRFQSPTGSTGHLDLVAVLLMLGSIVLSIPDGLHWPFRPSIRAIARFDLSLSIPDGLHWPFRLYLTYALQNAYDHFQSPTGSTGHLDFDFPLLVT